MKFIAGCNFMAAPASKEFAVFGKLFLVLYAALLILGKAGARHHQVSGLFGVVASSFVRIKKVVERPRGVDRPGQ